jgi:serine/threonine protein kinase
MTGPPLDHSELRLSPQVGKGFDMPPHSDPEQPTMTGDETPATLNTFRPAPGNGSLIGTVLGGRYLIEQELARGGMGVVYLARDKPQLLSRPVVVKLLLEEAMKSEWVMQKFRQEIEALTRLDDPGAVGIFDAGELPDKTPYFVMQYVEGANLRAALNPEGMNFERVAGILSQVGRTITRAHDKGIFHRDLKPENIMLREADGEEQVKVIDFGIAKVKNSVMAPSTATGIMAGTIAYMSPEQLSAQPLTSASDIYALGVIAYEMLTGRRPFNPESAFKLLEMQRAGLRVRPSDLRPSLPLAAEAVILKALCFAPRERYQRARDFTEALAHALTDEVSAPEDSTLPQTLLPTVQDEREKTADEDKAHQGQEPFLSKTVIYAAIAFLALVVAALAVWSPWKARVSNPAEARAVAPTVKSDTVQPANRTLSYWVEVQKYLDGKPHKTPMRLSGEIIYQLGDRVRFFFSSPQAGHLYVINEGPVWMQGLPTYNLLFPTPTANNASSALAANQQVQVPGTWFVMDDERGTERLWLVWSVDAIDDFENIARASVNRKTFGVIGESEQIKTVQAFISKHASTKPEVVKDEVQRLTTISGGTDVLVSLLKLEHY